MHKIHAVLHEKGAVKECTRCGHEQMEMLDSLVRAPGISTSDDAPVSDLILVGLVCQQCGHVVFHSPVKLGLNRL